MLSDRIKKFGIKSKENNESGQALTLKEHENLEFSAKPKTDSTSISANTDSKLEKESDNTSSEHAELLRPYSCEAVPHVPKKNRIILLRNMRNCFAGIWPKLLKE